MYFPVVVSGTGAAGGGFWEKLPFPVKLLEEIVPLSPLKILASGGDTWNSHTPLRAGLRRGSAAKMIQRKDRENLDLDNFRLQI